MQTESIVRQKFAALGTPTALVLPGGQRFGSELARVTVHVHDLGALAHLAAGQIGRIAEDYVDGRIEFGGTLRDLMAAAAQLVGADPTGHSGALPWSPFAPWQGLLQQRRSRARHHSERDARQIHFHYDLSDEFYALWLDPRRVYSCAYFAEPDMTLASAQEAKLEHICRKLMLRPGERFLDLGAGWGALLLWAAQHHGVHATGITLSRNQHAYVERLIDARGLRGRVTILLQDYRALPEHQPFDKIASVGMFEHVGHAQLPLYFRKLHALLAPGGLLLNHGITAGGTRNTELGAGIGAFIDRHIFPGGELQHVSRVLRELADARLEAVDVENLRPHYARTLWAWSDALESRLDAARALVDPARVRAYRMYLAGCAMSFEQGWISLHQVLAIRPTGAAGDGPLRGAQSAYPFQRGYIYRR